MTTIEEKCKLKGVRLTDQRKIIAQVMSDSKDHPDVDELHKKVSDIDKKISIATVYRTVKLFGEIIEFVNSDIEKLQNEVAKKLGYKLVDHKLELYGSKIKK